MSSIEATLSKLVADAAEALDKTARRRDDLRRAATMMQSRRHGADRHARLQPC